MRRYELRRYELSADKRAGKVPLFIFIYLAKPTHFITNTNNETVKVPLHQPKEKIYTCLCSCFILPKQHSLVTIKFTQNI